MGNSSTNQSTKIAKGNQGTALQDSQYKIKLIDFASTTDSLVVSSGYTE